MTSNKNNKDPLSGLDKQGKIDGALDLLVNSARNAKFGSQLSSINSSKSGRLPEDTVSYAAKRRVSVVNEIINEVEKN